MTQFYEELQDIRIRSIARYVFTQPASFWLVCGYLFLEYVRPQQIYPAIGFLPWGQLLILGSLAALVLEGKIPRPRTIGGTYLMVFTGAVILSCFFAFRPSIAFNQLELHLSWVLVFLIIITAVDTPERFLVFLLLFLLASFKMSQHAARSWASIGFGFRSWGVAGPGGWFQNSGEFAIQMCVFIPLAGAFIWALKDRWSPWKLGFFLLFPITALMGVIASSSRGAQVAVAVTLAWFLIFVSRRFKTFATVAVLAAATWIVMPDAQKERFETAGDDRTSTERTVRWEDGIEITNANPVFGVGYKNWTPYYQAHYPHRPRHGLVHNIFIEASAELGYVGLLAFLAMIYATFRLNWQTRRLVRGPPFEDKFLYASAYGLDGALVGYMASGFFVTVLFYPFFWVNLAMTVSLHLAARKRHAALRRAMADPREPGRPDELQRARPAPWSPVDPAPIRRDLNPGHGLG